MDLSPTPHTSKVWWWCARASLQCSSRVCEELPSAWEGHKCPLFIFQSGGPVLLHLGVNGNRTNSFSLHAKVPSGTDRIPRTARVGSRIPQTNRLVPCKPSCPQHNPSHSPYLSRQLECWGQGLWSPTPEPALPNAVRGMFWRNSAGVLVCLTYSIDAPLELAPPPIVCSMKGRGPFSSGRRRWLSSEHTGCASNHAGAWFTSLPARSSLVCCFSDIGSSPDVSDNCMRTTLALRCRVSNTALPMFVKMRGWRHEEWSSLPTCI